MEYVLIALVSFLAAGLTLFSGFGLGTILLPPFAIFFPIDAAIAMTAIVHLLNNIFKFILLGKSANKEVIVNFGLPAMLAAVAGAKFLFWMERCPPIFSYRLFDHDFSVTLVKVVIAALMIIFVVLELWPKFQTWSLDKKYLPWGGVLSGFFGGLSGHQGALRSVFLIKSGLSKEAFIATGVVIACLVDFSRLGVYSAHFASAGLNQHLGILGLAVFAAFTGSFLGNRLVKKVTLKTVQKIVSAMLIAIALLLGTGLI
jgi:uncharacterized membrane protein YfcA